MSALLDRISLRSGIVALALSLPLMPVQAQAQQSWEAGDVNLKVSAVGFIFDSSSDIEIGGMEVTDASATIDDGISAAAEIEYFLTPEISVAFNAGLPLETDVTPTGSLAPYGTAGKVEYGIGAGTLRYNVNLGSGIIPYVGAGVGRLVIFDETDGAVTDFKVDGKWAPVIQGGANVLLGDHMGAYANVTYAPLSTDATGNVLTLPSSFDMTLDPTVVQGGLFYRF